MNFHSYEKQIFKSYGCTKIQNNLKWTKTSRKEVRNPQPSTAIHNHFFLTVSTIRQVLIIPLLTENALFTWAFLRWVSKFLFFHQMIALKKLWKMFFISSKKPFSFSRCSNFCNFFSSFENFPDSKDKWTWNNLWFHELACMNLQMSFLEQLKNGSILHHQTWSDNI